MLRCRRVPPAAEWRPVSVPVAVVQQDQRRHLKCHDVRVYKPLAMPAEFRFYQRYTLHPARQTGLQFLTHYADHRRYNIKHDIVDYMHWGKEQGQAHMPHRHQRVAFDFNDDAHPTRLPAGQQGGAFEHQDPSLAAGQHKQLSGGFDPTSAVFSPVHSLNRIYTQRRPHQTEVFLYDKSISSVSGVADVIGHSSLPDRERFAASTTPGLDRPVGRVPGLNVPFRGELDGQHMQAMSVPLTADHRITANDGRFSKTLYINDPERDNVLSTGLATALAESIDEATNAVYSKLVVLKAAQSGVTDRFSSGMDLQQMAFDMSMAERLEHEAAALGVRHGKAVADRSLPVVLERLDRQRQEAVETAGRYRTRVDEALRSQAGLLWRVFTAARPLMTLVNGRCHNTGCGLALLSKFPALRDSSEIIVDGPHCGLTPYSGILSHLARPETAGKFPGLAEFTMLTGNALYAGDALRLGWADLYTSYEDMDYHIKSWFNDTEHMHNDAVAWQLGHLLDSCFRMKQHHNGALERSAVTPIRARWIEDAFADQPSVEAIVASLSAMEGLPTSPAATAEAAHNGFDIVHAPPFTLHSVDAAVEKLQANNLHFALAPWDATPTRDEAPDTGLPEPATDRDNARSKFAELFTQYVFERDSSGKTIAAPTTRRQLRKWREQRWSEYQDYVAMLQRPVRRQVFVQVEGCDGRLVDFEHMFDRNAAVQEALTRNNGTRRSAQPGEAPVDIAAMLTALKAAAAGAAGLDPARPLELAWYLPTLDTVRLATDEDLLKALHNDPGIEAPTAATPHPPVYFVLRRLTIHMSEWAYATKHQLLLSCPFALKASFKLLQMARTGGARTASADGEGENSVAALEAATMSVSESIATEFRFVSRMAQRPDFYRIGQNATRSMNEWEALDPAANALINATDGAYLPAPRFGDVFDRNVTVAGHPFRLRPRWSPATLEEVSDADIDALARPLSFSADRGVTEIHVPTYANKVHRVAAAINDIGGLDIVPGLGELDDQQRPKAAPLTSDAHVPANVNFYTMARHPWAETQTSWRQDGHTDASLAYMEDKYQHAVKQLHDPQGHNGHEYWAPKAAVEGDGSFEAEERGLLEDRLFGALRGASEGAEAWATSLRESAKAGKLQYRLEITTQQERFFDDEYYRWFVRPGEHPNPSGLVRDGKAVAAASSSGGAGGDSDAAALMASFLDSEDAAAGGELGADSTVAGDSTDVMDSE